VGLKEKYLQLTKITIFALCFRTHTFC